MLRRVVAMDDESQMFVSGNHAPVAEVYVARFQNGDPIRVLFAKGESPVVALT